MNSKNIFLNSCLNKKTPRTPVWIMRQAGRYLPEYRKIRSKNTFHEMMHNPDIMEEVTLLPLNRYKFDAAIMFSDILVIPESLGMQFELIPSVGPVFEKSFSRHDSISNLSFDENYFNNIYSGIKQIKKKLNNEKALIGFSGSPWTIACYMVEGKPSKDYRNLRSLIYEDPNTYHQLMTKLTDSIITYVKGQINAGVDVIQIFDTNASYLSKENFEKFSFPYLKRIIKEINDTKTPSILFVKGGGYWLDLLKDVNTNVLGIDWTIPIKYAREILKDDVSIQGNLDPSVLLAPNSVIELEVKKILKSYGSGYRHIFNLGHGITPDIPLEAVQTVIETVHRESPKYK